MLCINTHYLCISHPGLNEHVQQSHEVEFTETELIPIYLTDFVFCIPPWAPKNVDTQAPIAVLARKFSHFLL